MDIPGHWHLAGLDFTGKVWFRKRFRTESAQGTRLCFQGVDYAARVWLNGKFLGTHTGYFEPFAFDVSPHLKPGTENLVTVEVDGSPDPGFPFRKNFFKGGLGHWDMRPGGWTEHGQEKGSAGIWATVFLEKTGPACLENIITSVRKEKNSWVIEVKAKILNRRKSPQEAELAISLAPLNFSGKKDYTWTQKPVLAPGENEVSAELRVDDPELWWTWDMGIPNLYCLSARVLVDEKISDETEKKIGFREITWKRDGVYLNDRRVFLRGACYLSSLWLGIMTREKSLADIELVKRANMNSLRICYHIEPLQFYELCDETGILLWQDFPMLWDYDTSPESRVEADRQIRQMVHMLGHHPSIYLWCCHCEPMSLSNRKMDRELAKAVAQEEKTGRRIKPSTEMREHPFYGWYLGTKLGFVGLPSRPVPNEFGTQSLPCRDARLWKDLGEASWPPNPEWEYHNYQSDLFFSMRDCASLDEMITRSQNYQGEVLEFGIQAFRRAKGRVWGTYLFIFVDAWPSITWSIVDNERNTKTSYDKVRKAYQPVKISLDILQDDSTPSPFLAWRAWNNHFDLGTELKAKVWIINDLPQDIPDARLTWEVSGPEGKIASEEKQVVIKADSSKKASEISMPLAESLAQGQYKLSARVYKEDEQLDQEELTLFFGPKGSRTRNTRRQLRAWIRADLFHALLAIKTFPLNIIRAIMGRYKRYYQHGKP